MPVSSLCGYLPPAFPMSFVMDPTGGYPGGVWYFLPPLPDRVASDQGPGQLHCYLRGRRCTAAPNVSQNVQHSHVPQPLLHWVRRLRASLALYG